MPLTWNHSYLKHTRLTDSLAEIEKYTFLKLPQVTYPKHFFMIIVIVLRNSNVDATASGTAIFLFNITPP